MQIKKIFLYGFFISLTVGLGVSSGIFIAYKNIKDETQNNLAAQRIINSVFVRSTIMSDYLLYGGNRAREQLSQSHAQLGDVIASFEPSTDNEQALYASIVDSYERTSVFLARFLDVEKAPDDLTSASANSVLEDQRNRIIALLLQESQVTVAHTTKLSDETDAELAKYLGRSTWLFFAFCSAFLLLVACAWLVIHTKVARPLKSLSEDIQSFAQGKMVTLGAPEVARDEFGELRNSFREMVERRLHAESVVQEIAQEFQATFEHAALGIGRVDLDGHWTRVNQKLCDITGYSRLQLLSSSFADMTYVEDQAISNKAIASLLEGKTTECVLEKRYVTKSGDIVWCNVTVALVRDSQSKPLYFIKAVENIEKRKKTEAQLQQLAYQLSRSNEELENFAYVASHDLKAPLRGIENLASWLAKDLADVVDERSERYLSLLSNRVVRMETLLDGLLEYSRVGRAASSYESIDTKTLVLDVLNLVSLPDGVKVTVGEWMPTIVSDPVPLEMVFRNLIYNAVKHRDCDNTKVEVTAKDINDEIEFTIKDDGPGIPEEFHERIFGIF